MSLYNPQLGDERELGLFVRHQLNAGLSTLDKHQADRLFAARQIALRRYPKHQTELAFAGLGRHSWNSLEYGLRPTLIAGALILALFFGSQTISQQHVDALEDLDSALLSDSLPLNAYLDRGFQSWLASSSQP